MAQNHSLLFIPDISGFTEFVNSTDIDHSQHIISELLELIIDSNELDLTVSEIEGDAILFYRKDNVPEMTDMISQAKTMFVNFHNHLKRYESQRICNCGACSTASKLSLKIVAHSGEMGFIKVKDFEKPHGSEVILVHRLLKNDIDQGEYLLLTDPMFGEKENPALSGDSNWVEFKEGNSKYDDIGNVHYQYVPLSPLHSYVEEPTVIPLFPKMKKPIVLEIHVERELKKVFEVVTNFDYRLKWNDGVERLIYEKNRVNRVGTKHQCLVGKNMIDFETIKDDFGQDKKVYGEKTTTLPLAKEAAVYYIMSEENGGTKIRFECHYIMEPPLRGLKNPLFRLAIGINTKKLLAKIKEVCEAPA